MARKPKTNGSKFAGPDAEQEAIERLANAAKESAKKAGHNSGEVPDEVLTRNTLLIKEQLVTLDELLGQVAAARGVLGSRKKVAKKDGCDVDAIMLALKYEKRVKTGGASPIVAEHRQIGRILKILDCPLGTQFKLFDLPDVDKDGADLDAAAKGEQAGRAGADRAENPYAPGTPDWFSWNNHWQIGQDAIASTLGRGTGAAAH